MSVLSPTPPTPSAAGPLLAVALTDAGQRAPVPPALWAHLVREADLGLVDLVSLDVTGAAPASGATALEVATRAAPSTHRVALAPTAHARDSDPDSLALAVQRLHEWSRGGAAVQLQVPVPADVEGWAAAVRRRWTGTHRPLLALEGRGGAAAHLLGRAADLGFLAPRDAAGAARLVTAVRRARAADSAHGTGGAPGGAAGPHLFGDVVVLLDDDARRAEGRRGQVDGAAEHVFAGTPQGLADLVLEWHEAGLDGVRLRPVDLLHDLRGVTHGLVPELARRRGARTGLRSGQQQSPAACRPGRAVAPPAAPAAAPAAA